MRLEGISNLSQIVDFVKRMEEEVMNNGQLIMNNEQYAIPPQCHSELVSESGMYEKDNE